jgi:hypothetical protein
VFGPEPVQEVPHSGEPVRSNQKQVAGTVALLGHETRATKDSQVVGDDLLREPEFQRDLPNGQRTIPNVREDAAPGAVRQSL